MSPAETYMLGQKCGNDGTFSFPKLKKGRWQFAVSINGGKLVLTDWFATGDRTVEIRLSEGQQGKMPDIVGKTLNGESFRLSSLRGKYVLLDFWATWCGPCRHETPSVKAAYEAFKNDPRLVMVGLSLDNDAEAPRKYAAENGMGWTQVFLGNWQQAHIPAEFKVDGIPQIMLLGPDGALIARDLRGAVIGEAVQESLGVHGKLGIIGAAADKKSVGDVPEREGRQTPKVISASLTPSNDGAGPAQGTLSLNIDRDFEYVPEGFPLGLGVGQTDAPPTTTRLPKTLSAEPRYHSANVRYGFLPLGNAKDNRFTFALDDLDQQTWMGYFDRNNNGDLTDDGPPVPISSIIEFDVAIVLASGETVHRPYKVWLWGSTDTGEPGVRFYSRCHYRAEVSINGTNMRAIAFEKSNHDALYRDDGVWLDLNADNKLDEKTEFFKAGSTVTVKGHSFQVNLDYP